MHIVKTEYVELSREEIKALKLTSQIAESIAAKAEDPDLKKMYQNLYDALIRIEYCYDPTKEPKEEETKNENETLPVCD